MDMERPPPIQVIVQRQVKTASDLPADRQAPKRF
jgi:hypothetical protein